MEKEELAEYTIDMLAAYQHLRQVVDEHEAHLRATQLELAYTSQAVRNMVSGNIRIRLDGR